MVLTTELLDALSEKAKSCERLRMNLDLRTSSADQSQRMLNALEPGTQVPIHRHPTTNETVVLLRGSVREFFYDDKGNVTESVLLRAGAEPSAMNIPKGVWHTIESLAENSIIFECKEGPFVEHEVDGVLRLQP